MAVHAFQVYIGRGPMAVSDVESNINEWVENNAEWEADPVEHSLSERTVGGETYHTADVRFELSDAKENLVQKFTDKLKNKVAWYYVIYHRCDHDQEDRPGCGPFEQYLGGYINPVSVTTHGVRSEKDEWILNIRVHNTGHARQSGEVDVSAAPNGAEHAKTFAFDTSAGGSASFALETKESFDAVNDPDVTTSVTINETQIPLHAD